MAAQSSSRMYFRLHWRDAIALLLVSSMITTFCLVSTAIPKSLLRRAYETDMLVQGIDYQREILKIHEEKEVLFQRKTSSAIMSTSTTTTATSSSLDPSLWNGLQPRAFVPWQQNHDNKKKTLRDLCDQPGQTPPALSKTYQTGFLYLKPCKTGSSTTSGINLRIARNVARRLYGHSNSGANATQQNFTYCPSSYRHLVAHEAFASRNLQKSFLWTMLRHPTPRAQSSFFHFLVSRGEMPGHRKIQPNDTNFIEYLQRPSVHQHYLQRLPLAAPPAPPDNARARALANQIEYTNATLATHLLQTVLDDYNFVGTTERFDESLVVLQMLLDLPVDDILYLNAKTSGGYDDGQFESTCYYIVPKFTSPGMRDYFDTTESPWNQASQYDQRLYWAVHRSLDLTIEQLGRDAFAAKLQTFRAARARAVEVCQSTAVFPCLASGSRSKLRDRDCLFADAGCGYTCLSNVAAELREREQSAQRQQQPPRIRPQ